MVKEDVGINLKENPSELNNISVGMNQEGFLLGFNCDEKGTPEKAFVVPAEQLSQVIQMLFECGIKYQEETGVDIGFGMEDMEDE